MTHVTCRLTAKDRDQLRNTTLDNRVWATFLVWCHHEKSSVVWCGVSTPHPHYFSRGCGVVLLSAWCAWRLYEGWHSWATVDYSRSPAVVFLASTHLFSGLTSRTFSSVDYCCAAVNIRRTHGSNVRSRRGRGKVPLCTFLPFADTPQMSSRASAPRT